MDRYARKCDATGVGMNEGYVIGADDLHFSEKQHLIEYQRAVDWEWLTIEEMRDEHAKDFPESD